MRDGTASRALLPLALGGLAIWIGVDQALRLSWISDDAYISFRYADNLVRGLGLVFNAGERVEGYSNFLWTLWTALGLRLGFQAEAWANGWSVACHALTIATLAGLTWARRGRHPALALPVAALLVAVHRDMAIFATSGLETALVTFLAVAGYALLVLDDRRGCRIAAGAVLGLAALTRPDGILFGAIGGAYVLWTGRPRWKAALEYGVPLALIVAPYAAWKLAYYGDLFPNTYYAKSAYLSWWSQGWIYFLVYLKKYWVIALGLPLAAIAAWSGRTAAAVHDPDGSWGRDVVLAAAFALVYSLYVIRVGGDFMFARLLIPATPFWLLLVERGLERVVPERPWVAAAGAGLAIAGVALTPYPFHGQGWVSGIVNEREYYPAQERARSRALGLTLRRSFEGLPVRIAFTGTQAILAYYSRAPVAIEATAGLTDSAIAHQTLTQRGRVGHEKNAHYQYLLEQRKVHMILSSPHDMPDTLAAYIPVGRIVFDGTAMMVLRWDPPVMRELRRRGAEVEDFEPALDEYLRHIGELPDSTVRADYVKIRRFYFDAVRDSVRESVFRKRLGSRADRP